MSAPTVEFDVVSDRADRARGLSPAPGRRGRGAGRGRSPQSRPGRVPRAPLLDAPPLRQAREARVSSCTVTASAPASAGWRLTDRGIAAILVAAMMIVFAGALVVGLTALHVTSATYQSSGQSQLARR